MDHVSGHRGERGCDGESTTSIAYCRPPLLKRASVSVPCVWLVSARHIACVRSFTHARDLSLFIAVETDVDGPDLPPGPRLDGLVHAK